jgi:hypothetical protein
METDDTNLFIFWTETTYDKGQLSDAYHPLLCHMIDVTVKE